MAEETLTSFTTSSTLICSSVVLYRDKCDIELHCVRLWKSADTVFVLTQFQHDIQKSCSLHENTKSKCRNDDVADDDTSSTTRRRCTKTRKLNAKMPPSRTNVFFTTTFLRRQRRRPVMSCRRWRWHGGDDTPSRTCRRRVKKTARRANDESVCRICVSACYLVI